MVPEDGIRTDGAKKEFSVPRLHSILFNETDFEMVGLAVRNVSNQIYGLPLRIWQRESI